jgi:hypothetical protein
MTRNAYGVELAQIDFVDAADQAGQIDEVMASQ